MMAKHFAFEIPGANGRAVDPTEAVKSSERSVFELPPGIAVSHGFDLEDARRQLKTDNPEQEAAIMAAKGYRASLTFVHSSFNAPNGRLEVRLYDNRQDQVKQELYDDVAA